MGDNNAKSARTLPFTHRPFLRRQESHSHGRQQCQICPQFPVPPQTIPAKAGIYSNMGGIAALITPPLAAHDCEIPAYAGMVYLGIIVCWWILALWHTTL